jgi:hypothetical protein
MLEHLINTKDWQDLKDLLKEEFELKPGDINSNLSNEQIATEVKALNIARDRVNKFIRKVQAKAKADTKKESWK